MPALSPTNDHGRRHPSTVSLILAPAACSSPTASIVDLWPSPLGLHSSASHPAARAGAVSRPLLPRIQSTSHSSQVFTAPLGDIQLSSHVSCSCLGLTRRDFCNRSEALHPLRSTAKSEITVSRPRHQNEAQPGRPRKEHCRSRRAQHLWISFLDFGSPPRLGFMLSPPPSLHAMSPDHGRGAISVHAAKQTCGEAFLSLAVWQPSSGQTVASPWNARRKLKFPTNVVAESQISWAVVKQWLIQEGRGRKVQTDRSER